VFNYTVSAEGMKWDNIMNGEYIMVEKGVLKAVLNIVF
jgi:hypothetical protein